MDVLELLRSTGLPELFLGMVNRGIAACWVILAVLLVRLLLKKAPKWLFPVLWGVVGLRLCLPGSIQSALSLLPSAKTIDTTAHTLRPEIATGIPSVDHPINAYLGGHYAEGVTVSAHFLSNLCAYAGVVWVLGVFVLLGYLAVSTLRLRRRVADAALLRDNLYRSERVDTPFVLGLFRPRIYLPYGMSDADMELVTAHEQAHIRRGDHWWKPISFLLLSFYWFHPVLWLAYVLLCRDIELACDERVIAKLPSSKRADYSEALLRCSARSVRLAACPLAFGEVGVKQRVKSVLCYKKPAFWVVLIAVLLAAALSVCFLTNPKEDRTVIGGADASTDLTAQESYADLDEAITAAVLAREKGGFITTESHKILTSRKQGEHRLTAYALVYTLGFERQLGADGKPVERSGSYIPTAFTFTVDNRGRYVLEDYWEPRDGSYYAKDLKEKFPTGAYLGAMSMERYASALRASCLRQAGAVLNEAEPIELEIERLLAAICASPKSASNPQDYVNAHPKEYRQLLDDGEYTLRYLYGEFLKGGQTGLRGQVMRLVMDDLIDGEALKLHTENGQQYFDAFLANAEQMASQLSAEDLEKFHPAVWLLLQMR